MNKMGILFLFSFSYAIDVTSGGVLSENQASYDVQHYGIHLKIDAKTMPEKMEIKPKGSQNDAKMDTQIIIFDENSMKTSMRKSMPKKS